MAKVLFKRYETDAEVQASNIVDGQFIDELRDPRLKWRGSSNQRVIDVKKSLKKGEVVLFCN